MRIITSPLVQLGLNFQYPPLGPVQSRLSRCVGIHPRPPGIPLSSLLTCWSPSPCARLSRARTTTRPPPHPTRSADDVPIPPTRMDSRQREPCGMVPVFTANRLISVASSCAPATSPRVRRSPSSQPPHRHRKPATESTSHYGRLCVAPRPISARFEPVPRLRSFTTGSSRIPSDLARRTRPVWQCQTVPALSALPAILPGIPRVRLRSAPAKLLRQLDEKVLHLLRFSAPHGALRLHGAG